MSSEWWSVGTSSCCVCLIRPAEGARGAAAQTSCSEGPVSSSSSSFYNIAFDKLTFSLSPVCIFNVTFHFDASQVWLTPKLWTVDPKKSKYDNKLLQLVAKVVDRSSVFCMRGFTLQSIFAALVGKPLHGLPTFIICIFSHAAASTSFIGAAASGFPAVHHVLYIHHRPPRLTRGSKRSDKDRGGLVIHLARVTFRCLRLLDCKSP